MLLKEAKIPNRPLNYRLGRWRNILLRFRSPRLSLWHSFKLSKWRFYYSPVRIMDAAITMSGNNLNDAEDGASLKNMAATLKRVTGIRRGWRWNFKRSDLVRKLPLRLILLTLARRCSPCLVWSHKNTKILCISNREEESNFSFLFFNADSLYVDFIILCIQPFCVSMYHMLVDFNK